MIDAVVRLHVLVKLDADAFGFADALPGFSHGSSRPQQCLVDFLFTGAMIAEERSDFGKGGSTHGMIASVER